jgi:hypothetical protein
MHSSAHKNCAQFQKFLRAVLIFSARCFEIFCAQFSLESSALSLGSRPLFYTLKEGKTKLQAN